MRTIVLAVVLCGCSSSGFTSAGASGSAGSAWEGGVAEASAGAAGGGWEASGGGAGSAGDAEPTPDSGSDATTDGPVDLGADAYVHGWPFEGWPECQPEFGGVLCPEPDESAFQGECPPSICHAADGGLCCT